ncbi:hypothetical protein JN531_010275 [Flagellatimonas centrodinii]|uniref:hypothetical protein n=1 Tax=Flagellatimonas centrodinii TaxID=2806210 RepID=UPI001FEE1EC8|nr:hypothetical protein [Flagellatimonas centrodinii]ULQ45507.1 hypothetical protein JN531_010275 [Flagellatimonas centrodinii]
MPTPTADTGHETLPAIERFSALWQAIHQAEAPQSLEPLLIAAAEVQDAVMLLDDSQQAWLERLDADRFAQLQSEVPGFVFHRGYDIHAEIDGPALLALAQSSGRPADVAFFEQFVASYSDQALPVYLRFADSASPCVRFGEPVLLDQYAAWQQFRAQHPDSYGDFSRQWLADIEDVVAHGTCTCTEAQAPVEQTLSEFIERFPETTVRPQVVARLTQLRDDPYEKPVWCR